MARNKKKKKVSTRKLAVRCLEAWHCYDFEKGTKLLSKIKKRAKKGDKVALGLVQFGHAALTDDVSLTYH